jgi:hypothetical protein
MIVTSKRCYLNILTQLWPAVRLLNANYYIGDQQSSISTASITDQVGFDEYGQLQSLPGMNQVPTSFATVYHIKTSRALDPEPYRAQSVIMGDGGDGFNSPEERFIAYLNNPETFLAVYNFLFKDPLEGDGLQILIFADDANLLTFGHIICQYLSTNFGVDIIFIDPQYREGCRGYAQYMGNKEVGAKMIKEIRDYDMIFNFNQALSQSEVFGNISNIHTYLQSYDLEQTVYLYNLLWPHDPLPPGNYSIDHLRQIIIGKCSDNIVSRNNALPNLMLHDFRNIFSRAEREDADFDGDDTGLF